MLLSLLTAAVWSAVRITSEIHVANRASSRKYCIVSLLKTALASRSPHPSAAAHWQSPGWL